MSRRPDIRGHFWRFLGQSWKLGPGRFASGRGAGHDLYALHGNAGPVVGKPSSARHDGEADHQPLPLIAAETGEEATPEVAVRY